MNHLTHALAAICKDRLLDEKRLVAPSLRAGRAWLDAVTRSGQAVANVRTVTLRGLALELADPELTRRGLRLVSAQGGAVIVDRVLSELKGQGPAYLTQLTITPALCRSVYASIRDIRTAGLGADQVVPGAFEQLDKGTEFAAILKGFLAALEKRGLVDYAEALALATAQLKSRGSPFDPRALVLIPADLEHSLKEREFLAAFPQGTVRELPVDQPNELPDGRTVPLSNAELLRWVRRPADSPEAMVETPQTAEFFRAVGEINEVREVFRRCLARGIPLDDVEILHTDPDVYGPLIFETAVRLSPQYADVGDLFVTFEEGIPCRYARPGRALAAWVEWVRGGFAQSLLIAMLQEGLVPARSSDEAAISAASLAGALRSIGIGFGRDRYVPLLDRMLTALEKRRTIAQVDRESDELADAALKKDHLESQIAALQSVREISAGLLRLARGPDASAADVLNSAAEFVESYARSVTELDNYARRAIVDTIRDTARYLAPDGGPYAFDAWEWLSKLPDEITVLGSGPRPGCINVSSVFNGGHSLRKHTFILGLDEGRFPGAGIQDPVILDSERKSLADHVPTAEARLERKLDNFARLLARLRGSVTLSYPCIDLADNREQFPSQVVLNAFRIVSGERAADYSTLTARMGPPASFGTTDAAAALDLNEWLYSRFCGDEVIHEPGCVIERCFPHLARGKLAALGRAGPEFSEFDGRLRNPRAALDPRQKAGRTVSATSLETLGACPRRYFFRYVLDIAPPEEFGVDPEQWLSPMDFGTLLHEVLWEFVHNAAGRAWPPQLDRDLDALRAIARARADVWREVAPPPTEEAFLRRLNLLLLSVEVFLRDEAALTDRMPLFLEASVAAGGEGPGTTMDSKEPALLTLPDGTTIRARARFDRIDRLGGEDSKQHVICDYKSGSAYRYEEGDPFHRGRVVQHGLYHEIARDRLRQCVGPDAVVHHFEYYFPGWREHGLRLHYSPDELATFGEVATKLCDIAATGAFLPTDDSEKDCTYCDYRTVCGDPTQVDASTKAKLDHPANVALKPFRDLRSRE